MTKPKNSKKSVEDSQVEDNVSVSQLQADISACEKEIEEWKAKFVRSTADFENFSRRMEKEKGRWISKARSELIVDLLVVVDDFDRALEENCKKEHEEGIKTFLDGFDMIRKTLYKILGTYGVIEILETKVFDPNLHEAVVQVDSEDHKSGEIVQVLQKGFMVKDQVIRPAKVSVAK